MTTSKIEQLTAQLARIDAELPKLTAEFGKLDEQAVGQQIAALAGDADAAQQLQASQRARGLAKIQIDDLTAGRKHLDQQLAEAQAYAAKAEAAKCLPRLAELHAGVPDLFKQLEAGIAAVATASRALSGVENEASSAVYAAGRVLGLGRDDLNFRRTLGRDLPQAMLTAALAERPFDDEQPAARLQGAVWQAMRSLADETGAEMPEVSQ